MARTLWSGHISFGLVSIPISLASAEKTSQQLDFNLLDKKDHARIGYQKINKTTGEVITQDRIVKGLKLESGGYALFEEDQLKNLKIKGNKSIEIQQFVDEDEVDPMYFEKPYYMLAGKNGEKTYVLLRETLKKTRTMGVGLVNLNSRQHLAIIRAVGPALLLEILRFDHELKKASEYEFPDVQSRTTKISAREFEMATQLVEELKEKWNPKVFKDTYYDDVMKAVKRKNIVHPESGDEPATKNERRVSSVLDLMPLLEKSLKKSSKKSPTKKQKRA